MGDEEDDDAEEEEDCDEQEVVSKKPPKPFSHNARQPKQAVIPSPKVSCGSFREDCTCTNCNKTIVEVFFVCINVTDD